MPPRRRLDTFCRYGSNPPSWTLNRRISRFRSIRGRSAAGSGFCGAQGSNHHDSQAVTIHQDAFVYASVLGSGENLRHKLAPGRHAWVQNCPWQCIDERRSAGRRATGLRSARAGSVVHRRPGWQRVLFFDLVWNHAGCEIMQDINTLLPSARAPARRKNLLWHSALGAVQARAKHRLRWLRENVTIGTVDGVSVGGGNPIDGQGILSPLARWTSFGRMLW